MSELDFNYTLFVSAEDEANTPYSLQVSTDSFADQYQVGSGSVINSPDNEIGLLQLELTLLSGSDSTIIHDIDLGIFPVEGYIPHWMIEIIYVDESGQELRRKKKNTEQAKIESKPRPFIPQSF